MIDLKPVPQQPAFLPAFVALAQHKREAFVQKKIFQRAPLSFEVSLMILWQLDESL
jgi:hypothetical protein